jgi:hypothetical protein
MHKISKIFQGKSTCHLPSVTPKNGSAAYIFLSHFYFIFTAFNKRLLAAGWLEHEHHGEGGGGGCQRQLPRFPHQVPCILPVQISKTLYKETVHTYELRGCDDLFIWFGGPPTIVSRAPSSAVPSLSLPLGCYWLVQR